MQSSTSRGGARLLLDTAATTPPPSSTSTLDPLEDDFVSPTTAPLLLSTATAARWRRREGSKDLGNKDKNRNRAKSELVHIKVVEIAHMEEEHGVDVSWLHRPNKGNIYRACGRKFDYMLRIIQIFATITSIPNPRRM